MQQDIILQVKGLKTYYTGGGQIVPAVDGVDLEIREGEFLGIVGESGCGKSTVVRSIMGLIDPMYTEIAAGEVLYRGDKNLLKLSKKELYKIRGNDISMIFQNPLTSLNPVYTIGNQIAETIILHNKVTAQEARKKAIELLKLVGIPDPQERVRDYPHQLSGGMQQRVLIAIALANDPKLLIADEPTTALDVTIQAQILDLIRNLRKKLNISMVLISHNMGVIAETCEKMMVMYGGVAVESGDTKTIFQSPMHPYTQGLLQAVPKLDDDKEMLYNIRGQVPVFHVPVTKCRFCDRCPSVTEHCRNEEPGLYPTPSGSLARCWKYCGKEIHNG